MAAQLQPHASLQPAQMLTAPAPVIPASVKPDQLQAPQATQLAPIEAARFAHNLTLLNTIDRLTTETMAAFVGIGTIPTKGGSEEEIAEALIKECLQKAKRSKEGSVPPRDLSKELSKVSEMSMKMLQASQDTSLKQGEKVKHCVSILQSYFGASDVASQRSATFATQAVQMGLASKGAPQAKP